jgi:hypothetical protein
MKQLFFATVLMVASIAANAQLVSVSGPSSNATTTFINDPMNNRPYYQRSGDVDGSPFFNNNWSGGSIKTQNGIHYTGMMLKYDVLADGVVFLINDTMFTFAEPIREFTLNTGGKNGMPAKFVKASLIHKQLPGTFVQVLAEGKMNFYKHLKKTVVTLSAYNSTGKKIMEDQIIFYALQNGELKQVSLTKKALEEVMLNKWTQVNAYMEQNNLSAKSEQGWASAIAYYNTL